MVSDVLVVNGRTELRDPIARQGARYLFPAEDELEVLTSRYRERAEKLRTTYADRVGPPDQSTEVRLIYGDTFWRLALAKYGREVPAEAIFEANKLVPTVDKDSNKLVEPIYYAGKTYRLPAEDEIEELANAYRKQRQV